MHDPFSIFPVIISREKRENIAEKNKKKDKRDRK